MTVQPIRQPQDRRPAKKVTGGSKRRAQESMDAATFAVRVDGVDYVLNPHDITGAIEYRVRQKIGMGIAEMAALAERSPGVDQIGVLMWACRLSRGEDVSLMEVLEGISMGSDIDVIKNPEPAPKA